jgi:hypothetical protein
MSRPRVGVGRAGFCGRPRLFSRATTPPRAGSTAGSPGASPRLPRGLRPVIVGVINGSSTGHHRAGRSTGGRRSTARLLRSAGMIACGTVATSHSSTTRPASAANRPVFAVNRPSSISTNATAPWTPNVRVQAVSALPSAAGTTPPPSAACRNRAVAVAATQLTRPDGTMRVHPDTTEAPRCDRAGTRLGHGRRSHTRLGTFPVRVNTKRIALWPRSAVGSNINGQPPSITVIPCRRP